MTCEARPNASTDNLALTLVLDLHARRSSYAVFSLSFQAKDAPGSGSSADSDEDDDLPLSLLLSRTAAARRSGGKNDAGAAAAVPAAAASAAPIGRGGVAGAKTKGSKRHHAKPTISAEPAIPAEGASDKAGAEGGTAGGGSGGGKKGGVFPGYRRGDGISEESPLGLAREEDCPIDVLWDMVVPRSGRKAQTVRGELRLAVDD